MNDARILLVEDDFSYLVKLEIMLDRLGFNNIHKVDNGHDALKSIQLQQPNLILMDIQLNGNLTGIDIAKKIQAQNIPIIFITAQLNPKYFEKAKETAPYAYLNKPFDEITLQRSIVLALKFSTRKTHLPNKKEEDFIFIKKAGSLEKLNYIDILWIKSEGNHCTLFTADKKYVLKTSLTKLKAKFPNDKFIQTHRSTLAQIDKISQIDLKSKKVYIGKNTLEIGRSFQKGLIKRMGKSL